jgi:myxalamid-type nonribosomal peptide synthetase MxaA
MTDFADRLSRLNEDQRALLLAKLQQARGAQNRGSRIGPAPRDRNNVSLSFTQERLWFLEQFAPGTPFNNMSGVARVPVRVEPGLFGQCLDDVVQRHDILRMSFGMNDGAPAGAIAERVIVPLRVLTDVDDTERDRLFAEDARTPFDLADAPLLRVTIAPVGADECLIQLTMHHLISDGFSNGVFFREFGELYRARSAGLTPALPPLPFQFADFAWWERQRLEGSEGALLVKPWTAELAGAPAQLTLPSDHPRPARMTYQGDRMALDIPDALYERVQSRSKEHSVTPFVTMLAAFAVVLQRYSMQDDLVIGVPVANREESGTEKLIGPFLNTLAIRLDLAGDPAFAAVVEQAERVTLAGFERQSVPFEKVLQSVQTKRDPSRSPLFQTIFNFQFDRSGAAGGPGFELKDLHNGTCQFDLLVSLVAGSGTVDGHVDYYSDVYGATSVRTLIGSYLAVLSAVTEDWQLPIQSIPLLAGDLAPTDGTGGVPTVYDDACIDELIVTQARRTPERIALVGQGRSLTYRELDAQTAALAGQLRAQIDGEAGAHVAIYLPRSVEMVLAVVAVLRAGFSYIPLDPAYPADRINFIVADAQIAALLARRDGQGSLPHVDVPTIFIDDVPAGGTDVDPGQLAGGRSGDGRAYTIYTSGSTGTPKGVQVLHRNVVNLLDSMRKTPGLGPDDVLLAVTSPSFDIAALEMFLPLMVGARSVIADVTDVTDGAQLARLLDTHHVTVMQATPATWHLLIDSGWSGRVGLRALCGGETFPPALAEKLLTRCGEVWNCYGPTETTIYSTIHRVTVEDLRAGAIPIGRPIQNTSAYVLDRAFNAVPAGVLGELCLGGDGVALGYVGRPQLTDASFVVAPFAPRPRLYRTGDLVRRRADGVLEFAGRLDHQVKVRGYRIELGEIEAHLGQHPGVGRCVAVVAEEVPGDKTIVAYLEPAAHDGPAAPPAATELRAWLRDRLPDYMIPGRIMVLEEFPLTPNGKIDRNRLPAAMAGGGDDLATAPATAGYVAPRNETETRLVAIWKDVLGLSTVGVEDSFFDLGGHSMLATKLIFRIRTAFDVDLPLQALFESQPTVARLAVLVAAGLSEGGLPAAGVQRLDLAAEAILSPDIRPAPGAPVHSVAYPQHVFLTGATGFLGSFLLAELLATTDAMIFCLVRADSLSEGRDRIEATMAAYLILDPAHQDRIVPVLGSLDQTRLGLSRAEWYHLAQMVDVIYHCGADVNFLKPYQALKATNVRGTEEILRLACDGPVKPVQFVSTTYVFDRFCYPSGIVITEDMVPRHGVEHTFGYIQSKWVSEQMLVEAGRRGIPMYIYRPGRVAGHSLTGACQTYDFVWQATKVAIEMQAAPIIDMLIDITPVDYVARALVHVSRQSARQGMAYHLVAKNPVPESDLVDWIEKFGYAAERLPFEQWRYRVEQRAAELSDVTAGALAPFLSGTLPLDKMPRSSFDARRVEEALVGTDITCAPIDDRLLRLYFGYFIGTGYLPPPPSPTSEAHRKEPQ